MTLSQILELVDLDSLASQLAPPHQCWDQRSRGLACLAFVSAEEPDFRLRACAELYSLVCGYGPDLQTFLSFSFKLAGLSGLSYWDKRPNYKANFPTFQQPDPNCLEPDPGNLWRLIQLESSSQRPNATSRKSGGEHYLTRLPADHLSPFQTRTSLK